MFGTYLSLPLVLDCNFLYNKYYGNNFNYFNFIKVLF